MHSLVHVHVHSLDIMQDHLHALKDCLAKMKHQADSAVESRLRQLVFEAVRLRGVRLKIGANVNWIEKSGALPQPSSPASNDNRVSLYPKLMVSCCCCGMTWSAACSICALLLPILTR